MEDHGGASWQFTCPVARVVEMHSEGVRLMVGLPGGRRAVLIVGVGVVVVHVLARQNGGTGRATHGRGGESVGEMHATLLHDVSGFVHGLHRAWETAERGRTGVRGDFRAED